MDFWFLSFDPKTQNGSAVPLVFKGRSSGAVHVPYKECGGISYGKPPRKCEIVLFPEKEEDDLYRSVKVGVERAYDLLWQEGYVRESLTAYFLRENLPLNVDGSSGSLLFAVTTLVKVMRRPLAYPPIAATGVLDTKGWVQSVEGVPQKLRAALEAMSPGGMLFYPRQNEAQIDAELIAVAKHKYAQLLPVSRLDEAAQYLGIEICKIYLKAPYRGLFTFEYEHRAIYFGRQKEIVELRETLIRREANGKPGLLLVAASGAGKSSLVRAGLIPALEKGRTALPDRPIIWSTWKPSDCREKEKCETALVQSILAAWQGQPSAKAFFAEIAVPETLQDLAEQVVTVLPDDRRFLWLIDQFEEFFTAGYDRKSWKNLAEFLKNLQMAGVWIVATLRGDFFGEYLQSPFLQRFGNTGQFNLEPLDTAAIDQIIKGPAELAELKWELDEKGISLADRIRDDVGDDHNVLPLLEFTLDNLHRARTEHNNELRYDSYQAMRGLKGAIGEYAEDIFYNEDLLDDSARKSLPLLLWALTVAGETAEQRIVARPICLADSPIDAPVRKLIDVLTDNRLLIKDRKSQDDNAIYVRIVHDALLQHWETAKNIIDSFCHEKQLHDRLYGQAQRWEKSGQNSSLLLHTGIPLSEAQILLKDKRELLDKIVVLYIEASIAQESSRLEKERKTCLDNIRLLLVDGKIKDSIVELESFNQSYFNQN